MDWEKWLNEITASELDVRDKWLGIKFIKQRRAPQLYERASMEGNCIPFSKQAEGAAEYLSERQWGNEHPLSEADVPPTTRRTCRNLVSPSFAENDFNIGELKFVIAKMKKNKSPGPDEIPIEFFKWLDDENLNFVLSVINTWWNAGSFPEAKLKAFVASIYKKGDPKKQENYRPISLLCSIYKIYASLLQVRIAHAIDRDIYKTQYGFRKARSTAIPLACIRRILEKAEASKDPIHLVFLDWEKAFDRVKQDKLLECLERMSFPAKFVSAIRSFYSNPTFAVKIGNCESSWKTQQRGIRQGCPLSPYLFIILMSVLFRDIHDELNLTRGRLPGLDFTELIYADDTALVTANANAMNRLVAKIEEHAEYYGCDSTQESA